MLAAYSIAGYYGQPLGTPGLTGDGHRMGMALGADVVNMSKVVGIPGLTLPGAVSATYAPVGTSIFINLEGRRFVNESAFYDVKGIELLEQTEGRCYAVFDDAMREAGAGKLLFDAAPDMVLQAGTLAELAVQINIDPTAMEATIATWNTDAETGVDSQFGRAGNLTPIATAPFYAFETFTAVFDTIGGLKINTEGQVVNVLGDVIPRLYAAGVNAGGFVGEFYPGSGTALNAALLTYGRITGQNASAEESWE
jgi:fumarate reductase flavoprotein subunit